VVQLQHLTSGHFLALHKTPAPLNPSCRRVSLKPGSLAAHFRIMPRFKMRSVGSLVYADEPVIFRSVKHENLVLGASSAASDLGSPSTLPSTLPSFGPSGAGGKRARRASGFSASGQSGGGHSRSGGGGGGGGGEADDEEASLSTLDAKLPLVGPCSARPALAMRLPAVLAAEATSEVWTHENAPYQVPRTIALLGKVNAVHHECTPC